MTMAAYGYALTENRLKNLFPLFSLLQYPLLRGVCDLGGQFPQIVWVGVHCFCPAFRQHISRFKPRNGSKGATPFSAADFKNYRSRQWERSSEVIEGTTGIERGGGGTVVIRRNSQMSKQRELPLSPSFCLVSIFNLTDDQSRTLDIMWHKKILYLYALMFYSCHPFKEPLCFALIV